jgi:hypothetical protein
MADPTFTTVYKLLVRKGPGRAKSTRGTIYRIEARDGNIVAFPRSGRITVHEDCWLQNITCQGSRAGGIYNGPYSIVDWYIEQKYLARNGVSRDLTGPRVPPTGLPESFDIYFN